MRNALIIFIISIFFISCSSSKQVTAIDNNTENNESITIDTPFVNIDTLKLNDKELTEEQKYYASRSDTIIKKETFYITLGSQDSVEAEMIIYDDQVRVLMTIDDIRKINLKYRLSEILEELVLNYGIESSFNLQIINSLTEEVIFYEDQVKILNGQIDDKDALIAILQQKIKEMDIKQNLCEEKSQVKDQVIEDKEKEIKKQKRQKNAITIGGGFIIIMLLISLL